MMLRTITIARAISPTGMYNQANMIILSVNASISVCAFLYLRISRYEKNKIMSKESRNTRIHIPSSSKSLLTRYYL